MLIHTVYVIWHSLHVEIKALGLIKFKGVFYSVIYTENVSEAGTVFALFINISEL